MTKAKSYLTPIGHILGKTLKGKQWGNGLAFGKLCVKWPLIVGTTIAQHAEPSKIFGK
ncbi:MAG: DUF721 domain-containing protein, partial [Deltaproteobacteria bacterium]|nr:DUF721 domain-containing protein [Deltaproteobacteria bacterium]